MWETSKPNSNKFKAVSANDSSKIEEAFTQYQQKLSVGSSPNSVVAVADNLVVSDGFKSYLCRKSKQSELQNQLNP